MIGVLIPARNEEATLEACLKSVRASATHARGKGLDVHVVVTLDQCTDDSDPIARQWADTVLQTDVGNVGLARKMAADRLIALGVDWIASTDADSVVPKDWLWAQHACDADVFCGIVKVENWEDYDSAVVAAFHATIPTDGHPHIHGANLGLSARAYRLSGGFQPAQAHEDVELIRRCEAAGLQIARLIEPAVTTSARRDARARGGFGDFLLELERTTRAL
ncbi:glycosyltransferase [Diaphorobacter aerolatus]|uniref:Glycosyltransferase n=1 Tax=Diaphorobacter aerolatus TaxID=1288495 RepID=A0A7H0GLI1_9BURK|nr:glycosyltransferase [Diaphorobacter aerolatus]QNP49147.1 glycosyltransferase [Diaphorobacter aerolatus]